MELFNALVLWTITNPILGWLVIYLLILLVMYTIGVLYIGSWRFGLITGSIFVNGVSMVYATMATQSQPLWITALIFMVSIVIILFVVFPPPEVNQKEKR